MFITDAPYVSDFLKQTIKQRKAPLLGNEMALKHFKADDSFVCSDSDFLKIATAKKELRIYSNSENAIDWIATNLAHTNLPQKISLFKDKIQFRHLIKDMNPDYFFQGVPFAELCQLDFASLPKPFIIKPAVGFFSLGVHRVDSEKDWGKTLETITKEISSIQSLYPEQVLKLDNFIIEECIEGEEFAVDVYFGSDGQPVILNILGHLFASEKDVSDRVYYTSAGIINRWVDKFTAYLAKIGKRAALTNFPAHVELRVDSDGKIMPIEVNPMRFAGWCVADLTWHAYGFNPYAYYLDGLKPDWPAILKNRGDEVTGVVVADIAADVDCADIKSVDYKAFVSRFSNPLELRKIDFHEYPVFAFLFARAPESDLEDFQTILHSDLKEFLNMKKD